MNARRLSISLILLFLVLFATLGLAFSRVFEAPLRFVAAAHEVAIGKADILDAPAPYIDDLILAPQADQTWSGGATGNSTAWYTTSNWAGDAVPGSSAGVTTNTDTATIPSTGTTNPNATIGINLSTPTGNVHYLGAINFTGTVARSLGGKRQKAVKFPSRPSVVF